MKIYEYRMWVSTGDLVGHYEVHPHGDGALIEDYSAGHHVQTLAGYRSVDAAREQARELAEALVTRAIDEAKAHGVERDDGGPFDDYGISLQETSREQGDLQIAVVIDEEYRPEDLSDIDELIAEEQEKLTSGEWSAYGIVVYRECEEASIGLLCEDGWQCMDADVLGSVWGTVTNSGYDGTYDSPEQIGNDHLRQTARDVWGEAATNRPPDQSNSPRAADPVASASMDFPTSCTEAVVHPKPSSPSAPTVRAHRSLPPPSTAPRRGM